MSESNQMERRHGALAELVEFALRSDDLDAALTEACRLVADALGTGRAKVLEIQDDGRTLCVRAGVAWGEGVVGHVHLPIGDRSAETYSVKAGRPVVANDLANESRFDIPAWVREAGVQALATVPIFLPGGRPFGLLQVDARKPGFFRDRDTEFLRAYAAVMGLMIDRLLKAQAFEATERRFRAIVEAAQDYAIFITDPQDRITDWLPGAEAVYGWTAEEALGQPGALLFTPEDRETGVPEAEMKVARDTGRAADVRWHLRKDGSRVFIDGTVVALRNAGGELRGFQKIGQDVTKRRLAEGALRESEARFRALATAGANMIYRMSPDWQLMYQLDGRSILADTVGPAEAWADGYFLAEDRPAIFAAIDEAIRTKSLFELEHRVRRADGGIGWVVSRAVPMLGPDGEILEWFGAGRDVTERREAVDALHEREATYRADLERQVDERTAELKQSRDLLQATMDSSTDMIQVFEAVRDEGGAIVDFRWTLNNHAAEKSYGDVIGGSLIQKNPGVAAEGIFDTYKRVVETGEPHRSERHYVHEQFDGWFFQSIVKLGDGVATTTSDITERKKAELEVLRLRDEVAQANLHESEERFRGLVQGIAQAVWETDGEGVVVLDSPSWRAYTGQTLEQWLGSGWLDAIHPDDRDYAERQWRDCITARRNVDAEFRLSHAQGGWRWTNVRAVPITRPDGSVRKWAGINIDIDERKRAEEALRRREEERKRGELALRESEERLRSAVEVGRLGLWDWNIRTGEVHWSDEHFLMEGFEVGEITPSHQAWADRIHPDDRAAAEAAVKHAMEAGEEYVHEFRVVHPDNSIHWLYARGRFFYDSEHLAVRMVGAMVDTTERREWEERQNVMLAELQHRTRNLIAVVRSIAQQTMAITGPTEAFQEQFFDRLAALSRVQGLLSRSEQEPITIAALLRMELDALGAGEDRRVVLDGPERVRLRSSVVQTLALAIHELATNARKYGALATTDQGSLSVTWQVRQGDDGAGTAAGQRWLALEWVEQGVDPAREGQGPTTQGRGYGRHLIERALPYSLGARTTYELTEAGAVRCTIDLPLERTGRQRRPA